jgi:hypothetical protein
VVDNRDWQEGEYENNDSALLHPVDEFESAVISLIFGSNRDYVFLPFGA